MADQATQYNNRLLAIHALVERQARAWERNDFDLAAPDWLPNAVLTSPGGVIHASMLRAAINGFHELYSELSVTVTNVFASPDGSKVAIEWLWSVTRKRDGAASSTADAIIVDLVGDKIRSWREYFDLSTSVEAPE